MKRPGIDGNFILCYGFNLLLNIFWLVPVIACFILAAIFGWPGWVGWVALAIWAGIILLATIFMSWAVRTGSASATPTGMPGKTTMRRSSQRPDSLQEYARTHEHRNSDDKR